jgi:hypothetical protein
MKIYKESKTLNSEWFTSSIQTTTNAGKDAEEKESSQAVGGNGN